MVAWTRLPVLLLLFVQFAWAQEEISQDEIREILSFEIGAISRMGTDPMIVKAVRAQNAKNISLSEIKKIDAEWTRTKSITPFKRSLMDSLLGRYLNKRMMSNLESYSEMFLTDAQGANVAMTPATSDYWQGDETKWKASFNNGDGQIFIGPVEFDESARTNAVQVSVPVIDVDKTIGVLIVGIRFNYIKKGGKAIRTENNADSGSDSGQ